MVTGSAVATMMDHPAPMAGCVCGGISALVFGFIAGDYAEDVIEGKNPINRLQGEGHDGFFDGSNQDPNRQFLPHD